MYRDTPKAWLGPFAVMPMQVFDDLSAKVLKLLIVSAACIRSTEPGGSAGG